MTLLDVPPEPTDPARLRLEVARTCERLRAMSLVRLAAQLPDGRSRAQAAFDLAQLCADAAAALAGRPPTPLPELPDQVSGDALAACAQDLLEELEARPPESATQVCGTVVERLLELRRTL